MAIKVIDGFNEYGNISEVVGSVWSARAGGTIEVGLGQYTGNALKLVASQLLGFPLTGLGGETGYHRIGFSFKADTISVLSYLFRVGRYDAAYTGTVYQAMNVKLDALGKVLFYGSNNVLQWTSPEIVIIAGNWYYIEIGYKINDSGTVEVHINGNLLHTMTIDTKFGNYNNYPSIMGSSDTFHFDNLYFASDTTMPPSLGQCEVETSLPTADTAQADFTNGYTSIDDPIGNYDGDTTYISSTTLNHKSEFDIADITGVTIHALQLVTVARTDDVGVRGITPYILSSAARVDDDTEHFPSNGTYLSYVSQAHSVDPNTSVAWTAAGVNALKIGVEITT